MDRRGIILIIFMAFWFLSGPGSQPVVREDRVINDFETDSDLDHLHWKCRTLFSLSDEHPGHGHYGLKLELFPSMYPGVSFRGYPRRFMGYKDFRVDIFNPESQGSHIALRIDDKQKDPVYDDRYNHRFDLQPGMNHLVIPLESLQTPLGRPLDLCNIRALTFFMVNPTETKVLYMDNLRLTVSTTRS
ncbi:MAG: hypothetical protein KKD44_24970 [Proteobacteria bacterium]|nr:hypothetical protein [Pseudomonadota bacterium]